VFWIILSATKRFNVSNLFLGDEATFSPYWVLVAIVVLIFDWISLAKASYIMKMMSMLRITSLWTIVFVGADVLLTYVIASVSLIIITMLIVAQYGLTFLIAPDAAANFARLMTQHLFSNALRTTLLYVREPELNLSVILVTSTLLTSVWVILFLLSSIFVGALAPLEYIRRFTLWWFDIDRHPLKAIAKVAATLIVVGAFAMKAARWGWLLIV
jgi:hypothetical protein